MSDLIEDDPAPPSSTSEEVIGKVSSHQPKGAPSGPGYITKPVPRTYKERTQERLALIIVIWVLLLNSLIILAFLFGLTPSGGTLTEFLVGISGLHTLAAGVVGFYFGESRAKSTEAKE